MSKLVPWFCIGMLACVVGACIVADAPVIAWTLAGCLVVIFAAVVNSEEIAMTATIDATVDRDCNVRITMCDGERQMQVVFEDIDDAKTYHQILGFQIKRIERANAMKGEKE